MRISALLAALVLTCGLPAHGNEAEAGEAGNAIGSNIDELLDFEKADEEIEKEDQRKEEERIRQIHEIFKSRTGLDVLEDEIAKRIEIA